MTLSIHHLFPERFRTQRSAAANLRFARLFLGPSAPNIIERRGLLLFFSLHHFPLLLSLSISLSGLNTTVAAYFAIPTGSTEREADRIVD